MSELTISFFRQCLVNCSDKSNSGCLGSCDSELPDDFVYNTEYDLFFNPKKVDKLKLKLEQAEELNDQIFYFLEEMLKNPKNTDLLYNILWQAQAADPCEDYIVNCIVQGKFRNCTKIFKVLPTEKGPCCTFNIQKDVYKDSAFQKVVLKESRYFSTTNRFVISKFL